MKKYLLLLLLLVIPLLVFSDVDYKEGYLLNSQTINNLASHGAGYWFDGVNDYIAIDDTDDLSFGDGTNDSPFSISAWVNMDDATRFEIVSKGLYHENAEYAFNTYSDDKLNLWIYDESADNSYRNRYYDTTLTSYEGTWIHVVGTYDGRGGADAEDGIDLYLNGVVVDNTQHKTGTHVAMENLDSDVWIGKYGGYYANGEIDDVRIYNRELSATEVKDLYCNSNISYGDIGTDNTEFFTTAIDRTFTGGGTHWANVDIGTTFNEIGDLSLVASATGQYCKITFTDIGTTLEKDKDYRLTYDYSETTTGFEFKLVGTATQTLGNAVAGTSQIIEFTAEEDYTGTEWLGIYSKTADAATGDFDNFSLKQIGCVANWNSSGVGHNQWIDAGGNELNGEVIGAIPINLLVDDTQVLVLKGITGETTKTNWLPAGYAIKSIVYEIADDTDNFNIGFTDNGGEIVANVNLFDGETGSLIVLQEVDDLDNADTFYISATDWYAASLDLYITIQRVIVK